MTFDPIGDIMRHYKIPMTRENYVALNHLDDPPAEISSEEEEEELPEQFQTSYPTVEDALVAVEIAELKRLYTLGGQ